MMAVLRVNRCGDDGCCASGGSVSGVAIVPTLERCWPSISRLAGRICASKTTVRHADVAKALGCPLILRRLSSN